MTSISTLKRWKKRNGISTRGRNQYKDPQNSPDPHQTQNPHQIIKTITRPNTIIQNADIDVLATEDKNLSSCTKTEEDGTFLSATTLPPSPQTYEPYDGLGYDDPDDYNYTFNRERTWFNFENSETEEVFNSYLNRFSFENRQKLKEMFEYAEVGNGEEVSRLFDSFVDFVHENDDFGYSTVPIAILLCTFLEETWDNLLYGMDDIYDELQTHIKNNPLSVLNNG